MAETRRTWRGAAATGAASWITFEMVTLFAGAVAAYGVTLPHRLRHRAGILNMLGHWDVGWYTAIAQKGYMATSHVQVGGGGFQDSVAFPPAYPALMAGVSRALHVDVFHAGLLISAVALAAAVIGLFRLVQLDFGTPAAGLAVFFLLIWPTAPFFITVYTESLLVALFVWAFLFARQRRWLLAGVMLGGATLTKLHAPLLLGVPLLVEWIACRGWSWRRALHWRLVLLWAPAIAGLGLWMGYQQWRFAQPLRFLAAQKTWHPAGAAPLWNTLGTSIHDVVTLAVFQKNEGWIYTMDLVGVLILVPLAVYAWRHVRRSYGVMLGLGFLLFSSTGTLISDARYTLQLFPIAIVLAVIATRRSWLQRLLPAVLVPAELYVLSRFVVGLWAG